MNEIFLGDTLIKYQITFKENKNTYFYFKKDGYIQINASKQQKEKDIIDFIKINDKSFIKKYNKMQNRKLLDNKYRIWGIEYAKIEDRSAKSIVFNHYSKQVIEPCLEIDHLFRLYSTEEKSILLKEARTLKIKYLNNGYVDIKNIKLKTRYTSSRFGSCNYRLKTINLNLKLVHYNKKFLEYVFLHEIAHLVHQNHSTSFYNLLKKLCPKYIDLKKELNKEFERWYYVFTNIKRRYVRKKYWTIRFYTC